jgi:hypothetical protein
VSHAEQLSEHGYEHDVSFPAGGVAPTRAKLTAAEGWFRKQLDALRAKAHAQLAEAWRQRFCAADGYTLEDAARCARLGAPLPPGAVASLKEVLQEDAAHVPVLFAGKPAL